MSLEFELLERYDANVPRYTSYPTAPHFHDGVNGDSYRRLLSSVPAKEPVSLYFHVPFCAQMCWYCGCHTQVAARYEPISDYAKLLANEIEMVSKELPGRLRVGHLHWGGGTPTMLSAGTRASRKRRMPWGGPLMPIIAGMGSTEKPGVSRANTSAVNPSRPPSGLVRQQTRCRSAKSALVMKCLSPLRT